MREKRWLVASCGNSLIIGSALLKHVVGKILHANDSCESISCHFGQGCQLASRGFTIQNGVEAAALQINRRQAEAYRTSRDPHCDGSRPATKYSSMLLCSFTHPLFASM